MSDPTPEPTADRKMKRIGLGIAVYVVIVYLCGLILTFSWWRAFGFDAIALVALPISWWMQRTYNAAGSGSNHV